MTPPTPLSPAGATEPAASQSPPTHPVLLPRPASVQEFDFYFVYNGGRVCRIADIDLFSLSESDLQCAERSLDEASTKLKSIVTCRQVTEQVRNGIKILRTLHTAKLGRVRKATIRLVSTHGLEHFTSTVPLRYREWTDETDSVERYIMTVLRTCPFNLCLNLATWISPTSLRKLATSRNLVHFAQWCMDDSVGLVDIDVPEDAREKAFSIFGETPIWPAFYQEWLKNRRQFESRGNNPPLSPSQKEAHLSALEALQRMESGPIRWKKIPKTRNTTAADRRPTGSDTTDTRHQHENPNSNPAPFTPKSDDEVPWDAEAPMAKRRPRYSVSRSDSISISGASPAPTSHGSTVGETPIHHPVSLSPSPTPATAATTRSGSVQGASEATSEQSAVDCSTPRAFQAEPWGLRQSGPPPPQPPPQMTPLQEDHDPHHSWKQALHPNSFQPPYTTSSSWAYLPSVAARFEPPSQWTPGPGAALVDLDLDLFFQNFDYNQPSPHQMAQHVQTPSMAEHCTQCPSTSAGFSSGASSGAVVEPHELTAAGTGHWV